MNFPIIFTFAVKFSCVSELLAEISKYSDMCQTFDTHMPSGNFRQHVQAKNRTKILIFTFRGGGGGGDKFRVQGVQEEWIRSRKGIKGQNFCRRTEFLSFD